MSKKKVSIGVEGMHCASCAVKIEGKLKKMKGVHSANVNYATSRATVEFDPSMMKEQDIAGTISEMGYKAVEMKEDFADRERMSREKEISSLKKKVAIGGILSAIIFMGSFPQWFPFMPEFLMNEILILILATIVQFWVGWQFYRGFFIALKNKMADMNTLIAIGTSAAYLYSIGVILLGIGEEMYFDTSAIIITLILVGRLLEAIAKGKTSEAIKKLKKVFE